MAYTHSVSATAAVNRNIDDPTISITPVSGDTLLIVTVYIDDTSEGTLSSISDGTDTYTAAHSASQSNQGLWIYYVDGPTISAKTITANTTASCDTVINAATFQGDTHNTSLIGDTADGFQSVANTTVTTGDNGGSGMSAVGSDSLLIATFGYNDNGTPSSYGTGQTEIGSGTNGAGGERFGGHSSYEIITASGANEQTMTASKSAQCLVAAVEFRLEPGAAPTRSRVHII